MNEEAGYVAIALSDEEIASCFDVMAQLRPHLQRQDFVAKVQRMMHEGYRLANLSIHAAVVSVAGFRIHENLFHGKLLYVDDLVTANDAQSHGYGKCLIQWLASYARDHGCQYLDLDSGVQRFRAHRFYLREGMVISSHHFSLKL